LDGEKLGVGIFNEIGEYVARAKGLLNKHGWHRTCNILRGDRSDIHPNVKNLKHKAAPLMERIRRNGAPVILSSALWSEETKRERFAQGPHNSAHEFVELLGDKFLDFLKKGYWMLLPYEDVKDMVHVRYSPLGVVPQ
jgi:hypothetical protein